MYIIYCGSSSVGRASAFQAEGREFESRLPLHIFQTPGAKDFFGRCSSGVEHFHGKEGVKGSNPFIGSFYLYIILSLIFKVQKNFH
jgi:hypothetical protein